MRMNILRLANISASSFVKDEILTRGAAIAFYTVTSIGPLLLIVTGIAGMAYGRDAAQKAMVSQLAAVMGGGASDFLDAILSNNSAPKGALATTLGAITLMVTITGVFGEMQNALNAIWKTRPAATTVSAFIRARAASAGLVAILGFLMIVSLAVSAALTAAGARLEILFPYSQVILSVINTFVSFAIIAILFAAIYKVLPDRSLQWRDVAVGALVTSALFTAGKSLIGWYLGSSGIGSSYGAAGALMLLLLWVYYSVMIFLFGAEITKTYHLVSRAGGISRRRMAARSGERARGWPQAPATARATTLGEMKAGTR